MNLQFTGDEQKTTLSGGLDTVGETEELVVGPVSGYYLACYTVRTRGGFVGYAKVCYSHPSCPWSVLSWRKISSGPHATSEEAFEAVVTRSKSVLAKARPERLSLLRMFMKPAAD
ncbi:hypothetical protein EZ313_21270 [Ramlibacter henchirensis]|uniref:Uncharacterized protein n=1 Tax=Ramlibacter henchirensis TaxID=204072 RepID=A0A4Z0BNS6_9BURK|nr:hypothetical protein [Ramlibacter henchirensis]TFZ00963.1 hypothetical protein EZ313_21270 [Ramlibacter henchirensis]